MDTQIALLRAVAANKHDQTTRLALADWCEENGCEPRARLIRNVTSKHFVHHPDRPAAFTMLTVPAGFLSALSDDELPMVETCEVELARAIPGITWHSRNGFVCGLECPCDLWVQRGNDLLVEFPIEYVILTTWPTRPICGYIDAQSACRGDFLTQIIITIRLQELWQGVQFTLPRIDGQEAPPPRVPLRTTNLLEALGAPTRSNHGH